MQTDRPDQEPSNSSEPEYQPTPENQPDPEDQRPGVGAFPRLGTLLFIALTIVTLGLYLPYWMYTRSMILNQQLPQSAISTAFMSMAVSGYLVYSGLALYFNANPERMDILAVQQVFGLACNILYLIWIFKIRNRFHQLLGLAPGQRHWCNAVLTFLFNGFYVQYKINQCIDDETHQIVQRYTREL